jgi:hypothetical protein
MTHWGWARPGNDPPAVRVLVTAGRASCTARRRRDVLAMNAVRGALTAGDIRCDLAWSPVFRPGDHTLDDASPVAYSHLVCDGRGEAASHLAGRYAGGRLEVLASQPLPHSLGLFCEQATSHLRFLRSSDEYKVMALASHGRPRFAAELGRLVHADGQAGSAPGTCRGTAW